MSDKAVSKWETGKGLPDIGIIEELAGALGVSIAELMTGDLRENGNQSANMRKMCFYVCPVCGNIIASVGHGAFSCCGIDLPEAEAEKEDNGHCICVETVVQVFCCHQPSDGEGALYLVYRLCDIGYSEFGETISGAGDIRKVPEARAWHYLCILQQAWNV